MSGICGEGLVIMRGNLTFTIKRRSQPGWLCRVLLLLPFFLSFFTELLGLPGAIRYLTDLMWLLLLVLLLRFHGSLDMGKIRTQLWLAGLFLISTVLGYLPQYQSGLYYLWGFRNNFRFYIAFFSFALFLTEKDYWEYLKLFDKLFWISTVVSLIQYFLLGYKGDYLGGLFGVESGCNGYINIFYCIILTKSTVFYLDKRESACSCLGKFAAAMVLAALAELKFFFVEVMVILILAVLFADFSWRKVWVLLAGFGSVLVGAALLTVLFPEFAGFLTWDWLLSRASTSRGYTMSGDINRLNALAVIDQNFFSSWIQKLFGLGLGNCDSAGYAFLTTPFYRQHSYLHYSWLSTAFVYLETGYIGLLFFFGFFISVYLSAAKMEESGSDVSGSSCRMAKIMAVLCGLIAVYNASLRTEAAYMAYFMLAMPFAAGNKDKEATR